MSGLELEARCKDFVVRFLYALDRRDYDAVATSFATDGIWDRGGEALVGPDAVRTAMGNRPPDLETQHLALNMLVDLESVDSATVRYTVAAYAQNAGKDYHLHGMFRATDRLTHTDAGWRFAHRAVAPAFSTRD